MATPCVDKLADDQLDLGSGVVGGTTLSWPSLLHHRVISEALHPEPCCHAPLLQTTMSGKMKVRWPAFEESDASMKGRSRKDKSNYKNNVHKPIYYRIVWNCLFGGVFVSPTLFVQMGTSYSVPHYHRFLKGLGCIPRTFQCPL